MIITTKGSVFLLKKALKSTKADVLGFDTICQNLIIDPSTFIPERDVYILCSDDIKNKANTEMFLSALATKHPKSKVVFIDRSKKGTFVDTNIDGLNLYMLNPNPAEAAEKISNLIEMEIEDVIEQIEEDEDKDEIPKFQLEKPEVETAVDDEPVTMAQIKEEDIPDEPLVVHAEPEDKEFEPINRINRATTVVDVKHVAAEMTRQRLIKEMIDTSSTYAGIEEKLRSLNNSIYAILSDSTFSTLHEKMDATRAIFRDKAYFAAKGDTLMEQRIEDLVDTICEHTSVLQKKAKADVDKLIYALEKSASAGNDSMKLQGLNEKRNQLMTELVTMRTDIEELHGVTDDVVHNGILALINSIISGEENSFLKETLRANGDIPMPSEVLESISKTAQLTGKVADKFTDMRSEIQASIDTLNAIMELDREIITTQEAVIRMMNAKTVEDTIVNKTLLKSALKVYTGNEGNGRTIIPYILSEFKSRQRANVLFIDCTGKNKLDDYGIEYMDLNSYVSELPEQQFCIVSGNLNSTVENAQTILSALYKAADYYKVINIVLRPDQKEIFESLSSDILSINYIVNTKPSDVASIKPVIEETDYENVGKRVIFNKCEINIHRMIEQLGLVDRMDVSAVKIPVMPDVTSSSFERINPCVITNVKYIMEEVLKKC